MLLNPEALDLLGCRVLHEYPKVHPEQALRNLDRLWLTRIKVDVLTDSRIWDL